MNKLNNVLLDAILDIIWRMDNVLNVHQLAKDAIIMMFAIAAIQVLTLISPQPAPKIALMDIMLIHSHYYVLNAPTIARNAPARAPVQYVPLPSSLARMEIAKKLVLLMNSPLKEVKLARNALTDVANVVTLPIVNNVSMEGSRTMDLA